MSLPPGGAVDPGALAKLERRGGAGLVLRMVDLVVETLAARMRAAREALEAGDAAGLKYAVHAMRSSAGIVGAVRLQDVAARMEERVDGAEREELTRLLEALESAHEEVRAHLEGERRRLSG